MHAILVGPHCRTVTDLDRDGDADLDLLIAGRESKRVRWAGRPGCYPPPL